MYLKVRVPSSFPKSVSIWLLSFKSSETNKDFMLSSIQSNESTSSGYDIK